MPTKSTARKAQTARRSGQSASTQAGAFVEAEMHKLHKGKGRARSPKQAIAIGLSEARQAGVPVKSKGQGRKR